MSLILFQSSRCLVGWVRFDRFFKFLLCSFFQINSCLSRIFNKITAHFIKSGGIFFGINNEISLSCLASLEWGLRLADKLFFFIQNLLNLILIDLFCLRYNFINRDLTSLIKHVQSVFPIIFLNRTIFPFIPAAQNTHFKFTLELADKLLVTSVSASFELISKIFSEIRNELQIGVEFLLMLIS